MNKTKEVHHHHGSTGGAANILFAILTAMIGYHIHGSVFWTIMDFLFWPIALIKWLIFQEVNMTIIRQTFPWFFS